MSGNKNNVNRIPQDELAMRAILKDMGITGTAKNLKISANYEYRVYKMIQLEKKICYIDIIRYHITRSSKVSITSSLYTLYLWK